MARLHALGWDEGHAAAFSEHARAGLEPGRVIAVHRETAVVRTGSGGDRVAMVTGRFRYDAVGTADFPAVGDWVALATSEPSMPSAPSRPSATGGSASTVAIAAVLPRRGVISRWIGDDTDPAAATEQLIAANVDTAFIVAGLDDDLNLRRIERYLAVVLAGGAAPVVVLNKSDLIDDLAERELTVWAVAPGVPVVSVSALTGDGLGSLAPHLRPARTAVVLGSSGAGKSTLLNALLGEARQATAAVRADDSRGRHTTRHRELFVLPGGALLIDTPGLRSLGVAGAEQGLDAAFDDIESLASGCRFADCRHDTEPGCAVRAAIAAGELPAERLAAQHKLAREAAHAARATDPQARAAERRRHRAIHKSVSHHLKRKYGEDPA